MIYQSSGKDYNNPVKWIIIPGILFVGLGGFWWFSQNRLTVTPQVNNQPAVLEPSNSESDNTELKVIVSNLSVPWALAFLPSEEILVTERAGKVKKVLTDGSIKEIGTINEVKQTGESGLHGVALHPNFTRNNLVYFYYTYSSNGENTLNRVVRYKLENDQITNPQTILENIPGAIFHDGGRIKFGPDNNLYITTGDARIPSLAQDTKSLAGKILRVTDEGKPVTGNPFGNEVYSYGHRNPQGIAWDAKGVLWETEHGESALDEVNRIGMGKNYGWPEIRGDQTKSGMVSPITHSGSTTWAPSGMAFKDNRFYFAGLRGSGVFRFNPDNSGVEKIYGDFGRVREVVLGPDGFLYIATNNTDGRGTPKSGDDKIIRIKI